VRGASAGGASTGAGAGWLLLLVLVLVLLLNNQKISPLHRTTCTPLHPKDGRFDPTSRTSIDSPWRDLVPLSAAKRTIFRPI
jgi:hypothetical protein